MHSWLTWIDLSFQYLLHYIKSVQDLLPPHIVSKTPIASTAWAILRDSYHGNICLECEPEHLAVCSLYLALEMLGVEVPLNTRGECTWWEVRELAPSVSCLHPFIALTRIFRFKVTLSGWAFMFDQQMNLSQSILNLSNQSFVPFV